MATSTTKTGKSNSPRVKKARTPEGREQEIQALAMNLAHQRLLDGTASNQLICEIIKSASAEKQLKLEIMKNQNELLKAKTSAIQTQEQMALDYQEVLREVKKYSGSSPIEEEDEDVY